MLMSIVRPVIGATIDGQSQEHIGISLEEIRVPFLFVDLFDGGEDRDVALGVVVHYLPDDVRGVY